MSHCVLVGNGSQDRKLGDVVDTFEHVYRFNRFKLEGFVEYVGTRCTHWVLNNALTQQSHYTNNIKKIKKQHPEFLQTIVITESEKSLTKLKTLKKQYEDFDYIIDKGRLGKEKMSTGILTIKYLVSIYDYISLVGFDFGKSNHYWGNFSPSDKPGNHAWEEEQRFVNKLVESKKVKIL